MAASDGSPLNQPRIPAWKRIGLKLKFAKEQAEDHSRAATSNFPVVLETPIAKDNENRSIDDVRPSKRRKTSASSTIRSQPQRLVANGTTRHESIVEGRQGLRDAPSLEAKPEALTDDHDDVFQSFHVAASGQEIDHPPGHATKSKDRRKSVTFAPQTKLEDGYSASKLPSQADLDTQTVNAETAAFEASPGKPKKSKKEKTHRLRENTSQATDALNDPESNKSPVEKLPEYVRYLELFHADKASWKFNKKKQTDLLKNLFNLNQLPSEHDAAIVDYISGLQGAGACQRVAESATAVLKHIAEEDGNYDPEQRMESEQARRDAYSAALRRHLERAERAGLGSTEYVDQQVAEMKQEAEKGRRAEAVLGELLRKELYPNEEPPAAPQVPPTDPPSSGPDARSEVSTTTTTTTSKQKPTKVSKRKKRKTRTQGSPDVSSSESSESEGGYTPERGPATVHQALSIHPEPKLRDPLAKAASTKATGTKKIFDDDLLDQMFPKKQTYHETAPKRKAGETTKARGFAYTHGTRVDESGSEDE